jgi:hypothetical protein
MSRWSRRCAILNISQPYRPPRPLAGIALLYGDGVCFLWGTNWTVSVLQVASISQLTVSGLSRQCGILNISQSYRPPRPLAGIAFFRSDRLSTNIKLVLHKALVRFVMTYACTACESAADTHLIKLQRLQNRILTTTGKFPRSTPIRDMHMAFI